MVYSNWNRFHYICAKVNKYICCRGLPKFEKSQIRVLVFKDHDKRGDKCVMFDSKTAVRDESLQVLWPKLYAQLTFAVFCVRYFFFISLASSLFSCMTFSLIAKCRNGETEISHKLWCSIAGRNDIWFSWNDLQRPNSQGSFNKVLYGTVNWECRNCLCIF